MINSLYLSVGSPEKGLREIEREREIQGSFFTRMMMIEYNDPLLTFLPSHLTQVGALSQSPSSLLSGPVILCVPFLPFFSSTQHRLLHAFRSESNLREIK